MITGGPGFSQIYLRDRMAAVAFRIVLAGLFLITVVSSISIIALIVGVIRALIAESR